jgi:TPR repeat protein
VEAARLFRMACEGNEPTACGNLGLIYEFGRGGVVANHEEATRFYQKGCEGGDAVACRNLALMYVSGRGVPSDQAKATMLFIRACNGGDNESCELVRQRDDER